MKLKEVIYTIPEEDYSDNPCPNCGQLKLIHGPISCPDDMPGCCVLHYGFTCDNCGKIYQ